MIYLFIWLNLPKKVIFVIIEQKKGGKTMEYIDIIKYENYFKKSRLKRLLENKKALILLSVANANIPPALLIDNDALQALFLFTIGFNISLLRGYWKDLSLPEEVKISEILRTTTTYKDCVSEYNKYIEEVAKLVKKLGFESSRDTTAYLQLLLETGHFSKYMRHTYKIHSYEKEFLPELCGAKVLTGTSVCRHMSSFFTDILNVLGYTAANISAVTTEKNPVKVAQKTNNHWNHAVVGISENNISYLFDPTCGKYISQPKNISFKEVESILVRQYQEAISKYLIINPGPVVLNPKREKELSIINTSKPAQITDDEAKFYHEKAEIIYKGNSHNQYNFFVSQEERIKKVEGLYREISPYSDKPIKKWLVRK